MRRVKWGQLVVWRNVHVRLYDAMYVSNECCDSLRASLRAYVCVCVSTVCITVIWRWRHQRNRIKPVTGRLAQLVERTLSMREVEGSKPSLSTTFSILLPVEFSASLLMISLYLRLHHILRAPMTSNSSLVSISNSDVHIRKTSHRGYYQGYLIQLYRNV